MKPTIQPRPGTTEDQARSLYAVRRAIGVVGFSMPILLVIYGLGFELPGPNGTPFPGSISAFYHTHMGDVLVGSLCVVGIFMISYLGYKPKEGESRVLTDFWVSTAAGIGAMGVALLPTGPSLSQCPPGELVSLPGAAPTDPTFYCAVQGFVAHPEKLHLASAVLLFAAMAVMCLYLFPREGDRLEFRNREGQAYAGCGTLLILAAAGLVFVLVTGNDARSIVFILESLGVMAFSVAWLIKGKTAGGMRAALASMRRTKPNGE